MPARLSLARNDRKQRLIAGTKVGQQCGSTSDEWRQDSGTIQIDVRDNRQRRRQFGNLRKLRIVRLKVQIALMLARAEEVARMQ